MWKSISQFSHLSHVKNKASYKLFCESRLSKPFKHFPDRTQGCLVFCTQQRIIYVPVLFFLSVPFYGTISQASGFRGLIPRWEHKVNLRAWSWCWCAQRAPRHVVSLQMCWQGLCSEPALRVQPPCPHHSQLPTLYLRFLNRHNVSKQSLYIFLLLYSIFFFLMGNLAFIGTNLTQKPLFWVQDTSEK